jgi:hypothetical protein
MAVLSSRLPVKALAIVSSESNASLSHLWVRQDRLGKECQIGHCVVPATDAPHGTLQRSIINEIVVDAEVRDSPNGAHRLC